MEWKRIGELCSVLNGYAFKSSKYEDNGIRIMRITNVQKGIIVDDNPKFYTEDDMLDLERYLLKKNDILVSLTGNVGRVGVIKNELLPAALNQRVACLRPKNNDVLHDFLFHFLNNESFENMCIAASNGIAQKNLSTEVLKAVEVPVPPVETQQNIVQVLDKAQSLIDKRKEQIELIDEMIQSTFYEMFGDPILNPQRFSLSKLEKLGKWQSGGTPSRTIKEYFNGSIPWVSSGELNKMYIDETQEKITEEALSVSNAKLIKKGSLLLGMYDTAALKSSIASREMTCNQAIAFCEIEKSISNTYFVYWTIKIGRDHYRSLQRGVRQKNMNLRMIKDMQIIIPPIELQNQFAEIVLKIEAQKQLMQNSLTEMENNYNSLMQRAFKGELI